MAGGRARVRTRSGGGGDGGGGVRAPAFMQQPHLLREEGLPLVHLVEECQRKHT